MNKQEAIEEILKNNHTKLGLDFDDEVRVTTVIDVINQIDEPEKPVIPQFVAEWIEKTKGHKNLYEAMKDISYVFADTEILDWFCDDIELKSEFLARAWLDGYEVEKEQMYTVVIPNPNIDKSHITALMRMEDDTIELGIFVRPDLSKSKFNLTESEIKEDFEWAWEAGFAKPVEEVE